MSASTNYYHESPVRSQSVSVLGTGTMGAAIAGRLLQAGLETVVWDRSAEATADLANRGAVVAASPQEAVAKTDIVITMLPTVDTIVSVVDDDVLNAIRPQ